MSYAIEHSETGRLLKKPRPRVCENCGQEHLNQNRKKWTSDVSEAEMFDDKGEAVKEANKLFLSQNRYKRRKINVIEI